MIATVLAEPRDDDLPVINVPASTIRKAEVAAKE
jgi:hypothetical protein